MTSELNQMSKSLNNDLTNGKGTLHTLLKDNEMSQNLKQSMANIQKGTDNFNQVMESLKHSFLFRGYFRKQEAKKQQELDKAQALPKQ